MCVQTEWFPHHSLKHGGVGGGCGVRRVGHALRQVTGAVQRVCGGPLFERLLAIKKHQLKRHWKFLGGNQIEMHVRDSSTRG